MANVTPGGAEIVACYLDETCEMAQCEICLAEIPVNVAERFEGADYVHHFCGLECYGIWRAVHEHKLT